VQGVAGRLERRLAQAVLEVCSFESVVVDAQQTLPAADRDPCDRIGEIKRP
jgi:PIN domain nuclease of toxin-antitoxin system